jgi:hypothetical protein
MIVELGDRLDPVERFKFSLLIQARDLTFQAAPDRTRSRIGDEKAQLPKAPTAAALPHRPHPFRRRNHHLAPVRNALQL